MNDESKRIQGAMDRLDELKRLELATEVAAYLIEVAGKLKDMKSGAIYDIRNAVRQIVEQGW